MADTKLKKKYNEYLKSCSDKLLIAQRIRQNYEKYITLEQNKIIFGEIATDYDNSFSNAEYLHSLGFDDADLLGTIHHIFDNSLRNVVLNRPIFVWNKSDLLVALKKYFNDFDRAVLQAELDKQSRIAQYKQDDSRMLESSIADNCFNNVLSSANPKNLDWMAGYGVFISTVEQQMCRFWYDLPDEMINKMAVHIVDAFFHGFISQSRYVDGRTNVRIMYAIGQEALAQKIVKMFRQRGMEPIILQPSSIAYSQQCLADHRYDEAICQERETYEVQADAYSVATERYYDFIKNSCGFVRVGTFGNEVQPVVPGIHSYHPNEDVMKMYRKMIVQKRNIEAKVLRPDNLSFCSVVFPDKRVGDNFKEVFNAFYELNTERSEPYELIQKDLIEILDKCGSVYLEGINGNKTNITVQIGSLENEEKQTNFLNCGGDINIPHGEMFTTPKLNGTNGILNVKEIYLKDKYYKNLILTFHNGKVVDYGCSNFDDNDKNKKYVLENLLNGMKNPPMGELSIGTNTLAYKIAEELNLFSRLPILLAEKMGPHIAVGDPCFARGEDSPVFNIYGGKEMVARDNEMTQRRGEDPDCYVNFHTDITIPYKEMGLFVGTDRHTGEQHVIIKDGKFVPDIAQRLNDNLR